MSPHSILRVEIVKSEQLQDLRRTVFFDNDPDIQVADPKDTRPDSLHVAAFLDSHLVAGASFFPTEPPFDSQLTAAQLRYMAVLEDFQRHGYGAALLDSSTPLLREAGVEILWANARLSALPFYRANSWTEIPGTEHISPPPTSLPHSVIYKVIREGAPLRSSP